MVRRHTTNTYIKKIIFLTIATVILNFHLHCSPILEADRSIDDGVYVFPLKDNVSQPCPFDVLILKNSTTDFKLCVVLFTDASDMYK